MRWCSDKCVTVIKLNMNVDDACYDDYSGVTLEDSAEVELLRNKRQSTRRRDIVADCIFSCFSLLPNVLLLAFYGVGIYLVINNDVSLC